MRYLSVFSGIEAATVAWEPLGFVPVAFSEIDEFPCAVLKARFPSVPNLGDITQIDWPEFKESYGPVDVVVGGSPCQSFSIAGGRESLTGASRLMFEYIRCLDEVRPRAFVWENVPGVLSTRDDAFGQLLTEVDKLGYQDVAWRVLDSQFFGVAQRRARVFLVGHLGEGLRSTAVLFERESLLGNYSSVRAKREAIARTARGSDEARGKSYAVKTRTGSNTYLKVDGSVGTAGKGALVGDDVAFTLSTRSDQTIVQQVVCMAHGQAHAETTTDGTSPTLTCLHEQPIVTFEDSQSDMAVTIHDGSSWVVRRITPLEGERLQGFPDGYTDIGDWVDSLGKRRSSSSSARFKALGNSMCVNVMAWIGGRLLEVDS